MSQNFTDDFISPELVRKAAEGDDKAMAELISAAMPAAAAKASKLNYETSRIPDEDLAQEGMIGFLEAVRRYDASKGVPFTAYANICIESRILNALRKNSNEKNAALSTAVPIEDSDEEPSGDDPASIFDSIEEIARIHRLIEENLSAFEQSILRMKLEGLPYRDIALKMECTEKSVDNAIQRIRKKLNSII